MIKVRHIRSKQVAVFFMLLLYADFLAAQIQLTPFLTASTGNYRTAGGISLSSSVGEPITTTLHHSTIILTQGFQQPSKRLALEVIVVGKNTDCAGSNTGFAVARVIKGSPPYSYQWKHNGGKKDTAFSLSAGTYVVTITDGKGNSVTDSVKISDNLADCEEQIHIYTGITPNNDNYNDTWQMDGIEKFSSNTVTIFNRWGNQVWHAKNYDNKTIVWSGTNSQGDLLPSGTYFYTVEVGLRTYKGWVELTQ